MGLSINYSGSFNPNASLQEMIEEVKDIAKIYQWKYHIYETSFPKQTDKEKYDDKIYGISFKPPDCETISLEFLSNMRMSSSVHLDFFGNSDNKEYQQYLYLLSVKTQFAGIKIHMLIIHLLKYLEKKYFLNFQVNDEGKYWETSDEDVLKGMFSRYNELLDSVCDGIQNFPAKPGESLESYFERLIEYISKNKDKK
jgi:hypothetical protein